MARIAVVGGGIIGLATAWRLAQSGFQVTVFERGDAGTEATWAAAGMLAPGGEVEGPGELASLSIEARALYPAFVRELATASGESIDYQECGGLSLAYSSAERDELEARAAVQADLGIKSKPLRAVEVRQFWPLVRTQGLLGARFYPGDAVVAPRDLVRALVPACKIAGVEFELGCTVNSLTVDAEPGAGSVRLAVKGEQGFDAAVIAAGAWSSQVAVHGVDPLPPSEPVKGHMIAYQMPAQTCSTILRHGHTYMLQRENGQLISGSTMQRVGFHREISPEITASLERKAAFLLPHLAETYPAEAWTGFRPASDALHIGAWQSERLLLAYGHFRNGILLAPLTAERIRKHLLSFHL